MPDRTTTAPASGVLMSQMYVGTVVLGRSSKVTVFDDDGAHPLELHVRHSPDGHTWGYGGSGPAQLALDLLWDVTGAEPERVVYQRFMRAVIARFDKDKDWQMPAAKIADWLTEHFPAFYPKEST